MCSIQKTNDLKALLIHSMQPDVRYETEYSYHLYFCIHKTFKLSNNTLIPYVYIGFAMSFIDI